jgi:hypothetical protein
MTSHCFLPILPCSINVHSFALQPGNLLAAKQARFREAKDSPTPRKVLATENPPIVQESFTFVKVLLFFRTCLDAFPGMPHSALTHEYALNLQAPLLVYDQLIIFRYSLVDSRHC